MQVTLSAINVAFAALLFQTAHAAGTSEPSTLPEFKLVAGFGNGSIVVDDSVYSWDITITSAGKATVEAYRSGNKNPERRQVALPRSAVEQIISALDRAEFSALPADMDGRISDSPVYTLEVTRGGKRHGVRVSAPAGIHDKALLKRFLLVWESIFRYVHSPSGEGPIEHLRANS